MCWALVARGEQTSHAREMAHGDVLSKVGEAAKLCLLSVPSHAFLRAASLWGQLLEVEAGFVRLGPCRGPQQLGVHLCALRGCAVARASGRWLGGVPLVFRSASRVRPSHLGESGRSSGLCL